MRRYRHKYFKSIKAGQIGHDCGKVLAGNCSVPKIYQDCFENGSDREYRKSRVVLRPGLVNLGRKRGYRTVTLVPMGTRLYRSSTCSFNIRIQPFDTERPIDRGAVVP